MIDFSHLIVLSLVQGITEFLPISSSAHLIIIPKIFQWDYQGILFDVSMHFGSLIAVIWYYIKYQKDFLDLDSSKNYIEFNKLIVGSLPVLSFGYLFHDYISNNLRTTEIIGLTSIIVAALLIFTEFFKKDFKNIKNITNSDMMIIGVFQTFALIPGVSRSAIVILVALILGYDKKSSILIALLLSFPVIIIAMGYEMYSANIFLMDLNTIFKILVSIITSAVTSFIVIKYFIYYINKTGFYPFMLYRIFLGILLLNFFT